MKNNTIVVKMTALVTSAVFLLSPMAGLAAADQTALSSTSAASVTMQNNAYSPQHVTVQVGSIVTWTNWDNMPHTVTSDTGLFNSGSINYGSSYGVQFNSVGTFRYYCQFHGAPGGSGMSGTVTVVSGQTGGNSLTGTVVASQGGSIVINSITPVKTSGTADGNFQNGWSWVFDISAPQNETNLMMKFDNWLQNQTGYTIPVTNNMRFYSAQSSNASNQGNAVYITAPGTYSSSMILNGDLDSGSARRVQITVEVRIPTGSQTGTYTTNFGIKTQ